MQTQQQAQESQAPLKFEKQATLSSNTTSNLAENKQSKTQAANTQGNANTNTNTQPTPHQTASSNNTASNANKPPQAEKPKLVRPDSAMKRPEKINSEIKEVKEDPNRTYKKVSYMRFTTILFCNTLGSSRSHKRQQKKR